MDLGAVYFSNCFCRRIQVDGYNTPGWAAYRLSPGAISQEIPLVDPDYSGLGTAFHGRVGYYNTPPDNMMYQSVQGGSFQQSYPVLTDEKHVEPSYFNTDDFACNPQCIPSNYQAGVPLGVDYMCNRHKCDTVSGFSWSATDLMQNPQGSVRPSGVHAMAREIGALPIVTRIAAQVYNANGTNGGLSNETILTAPLELSQYERSKDGRLPRFLWIGSRARSNVRHSNVNGNTKQLQQLLRSAIRANSGSKSQTPPGATAATVTKKQDRPVSGGVGYLEQPLLLPVSALRDNHF